MGKAKQDEKLAGWRDEVPVDAKEVARVKEVAISWVYSQAEAGRIPHLKIGKYLRFYPSEVEAWFESQRRGPDPRQLTIPFPEKKS